MLDIFWKLTYHIDKESLEIFVKLRIIEIFIENCKEKVNKKWL